MHQIAFKIVFFFVQKPTPNYEAHHIFLIIWINGKSLEHNKKTRWFQFLNVSCYYSSDIWKLFLKQFYLLFETIQHARVNTKHSNTFWLLFFCCSSIRCTDHILSFLFKFNLSTFRRSVEIACDLSNFRTLCVMLQG
jgi:hypothetical protein